MRWGLKPRTDARTLWAGVLLAGSVLLTPEARAGPGLELSGGYQSQWLTSRSDDLVATSDVLPQVSLSVAVQPTRAIAPFWVELDYMYGATNAPVHQTGFAGLGLNHLELSALYRRPFGWGRLGWFVRGGPSVTLGRLTLQDNAYNTIADQSQVEPGLSGALGLELPFFASYDEQPPGEERDRHLGVGLRAEAGYRWQPDFGFHRVTQTSSPTASSPTAAPLSIGSVAAAGFEARLALFFRF
jgi:hypothetical protein